MPTEAVTTTKTVKAAARTEPARPKPDPQQGCFRRRNRTVNGQVVAEEQRPGSKAWQRVD